MVHAMLSFVDADVDTDKDDEGLPAGKEPIKLSSSPCLNLGGFI